jgi:hypothetical protein
MAVTTRRGAGGAAEHTFASYHHDHEPMTPAEMFDAVDTSRSGAGTAPPRRVIYVRKKLGWPKRCELAHAFLWEYSNCYKRLKLATSGPTRVFLTISQ